MHDNTKKFYNYFRNSYIRLLPDKAKDKGKLPTFAMPFSEITKEKLRDLYEKNKEGYGVFFTPNPTNGGTKNTDVTELVWVFCDIDEGTKEDQMKVIKTSPIPPTIIVETGNGYHLYWHTEALGLETFKEIMDGIIEFFGADENAKNPARLLRLPPFYHMKAEPKPIKIIEINDNKFEKKDLQSSFQRSKKEEKTYETNSDLSDVKGLSIMQVLNDLGADVRSNTVWENGEPTSWKVNTKENYSTRFSGKAGGGTVIDAVMYLKNLDVKGAIKWLRETYNLQPKTKQSPERELVTQTVKWNDALRDAVKENAEADPEQAFEYGYDFLDNKIGGIFEGEVVLIGGITGTGKTTLAIKVAEGLANKGKKVLVMAMEDRITTRARKSILYEVNRNRRKRGEQPISMINYLKGITKPSKVEQQEAINAIQNDNIEYLKCDRYLDTTDLEEIYKNHKADLYILDHLHYFSHARQDMSKADSIENAMQRIKNATVRYGTRTILIAHFKKLDEMRRPTMTDFKDSISIAQTVDTVIMLWRNRSESCPDENRFLTEFIVPKNRIDVPTFTAEALFDLPTNDYIRHTKIIEGTKNCEAEQEKAIMEIWPEAKPTKLFN